MKTNTHLRTGEQLRIGFPFPPRMMDKSGFVYAIKLHSRDGLGSGLPNECVVVVGQKLGQGKKFL